MHTLYYVDVSKTQRVRALYGGGEIILVADGIALQAKIDRELLLQLLTTDPNLLISGNNIVDTTLLKHIVVWLNNSLRRAEELAKQRDRPDIVRWTVEVRKLLGWIAALLENPKLVDEKTIKVTTADR